MKICIPIAFKPQGGGQYFLQLFAEYLLRHEHEVVSDVDERYDVLFTNHWMVPFGQILRGIRRNPDVRVVQRIDGAAADYGRGGNADRRQRAVNHVADLTIFQSEYCRWATREKFRVITQNGPVIHNPVDTDRFTPDGGRLLLSEATRLVSVSWSLNPRKGAAKVLEAARANPDVGFYLCGRYSDVPAQPNVHHLGVIGRDTLATMLRSCHALLTFSENEACPNHVLEALASGCPVLYADSGAMREVIGEGGLPVTVDVVQERLAEVLANWSCWSTRARQRALERFHPDTVLSTYLDAIKAAIANPPRLGRSLRHALVAARPLLAPFKRWGWA